jgi:CheY-like chemotaxis protein
MIKVLVVDDERNVRRLVMATLDGGDYQLIEARDGNEAVEVARRERPAVILLDIRMPVMDGLDACRAIRSDPRMKGAMIVMLTAQVHADVRNRATAAGADTYLTKPFSPLELTAMLERRVSKA